MRKPPRIPALRGPRLWGWTVAAALWSACFFLSGGWAATDFPGLSRFFNWLITIALLYLLLAIGKRR